MTHLVGIFGIRVVFLFFFIFFFLARKWAPSKRHVFLQPGWIHEPDVVTLLALCVTEKEKLA
jgi:hypothetical protein